MELLKTKSKWVENFKHKNNLDIRFYKILKFLKKNGNEDQA